MQRLCHCDRIDPRPGARYTKDQCSRCYQYHHHLKAKSPDLDPRSQASCVHRSTYELRREKCDCPGGMAVYRCDSPDTSGECVLAAPTPSREAVVEAQQLAVCRDCQFKKPRNIPVSLPLVEYFCRHRYSLGKTEDVGACDGREVEVFLCNLTNKECTFETQVPGAVLCAACAHRSPVVATVADKKATRVPDRPLVEITAKDQPERTQLTCPPQPELAGLYLCQVRKRDNLKRVRLAPDGSVQGDISGGVRWGFDGVRIVIFGLAGDVLRSLEHSGETWSDASGEWAMVAVNAVNGWQFLTLTTQHATLAFNGG